MFRNFGLMGGVEPTFRNPIPWKKFLELAAVLFALTAGCTYYLSTYKTLEDAVVARDFGLIERRLRFNLQGVGVDDGVVEPYSGGVFTHSLLTLVPEEDLELRLFLIEKREGVTTDPRRSPPHYDNLLVDAVRYGDLEIAKQLLEKGADPSAVLDKADMFREELEADRGRQVLRYIEEHEAGLVDENDLE